MEGQLHNYSQSSTIDLVVKSHEISVAKIDIYIITDIYNVHFYPQKYIFEELSSIKKNIYIINTYLTIKKSKCLTWRQEIPSPLQSEASTNFFGNLLQRPDPSKQ